MHNLEIIFWLFVFFITSFFYSSTGLGGASAFLAYLSIMKIDYKIIPSLALFLSIISSLTSSIIWIKSGNFNKKTIPFIIFSSPAAFLGGKLTIQEKTFNILLIITLVSVGVSMFFERNKSEKDDVEEKGLLEWLIALFLSSAIGFFSGIVGIGGGIFLIPLLVKLKFMSQKEASAAGAVFILINSISGFIGQSSKIKPDIYNIAKFSVPVILGAFFGSYISSTKLKPSTIKKVFGSVLIFISLLKFLEFIGLIRLRR
jgi:hypothetical protein